MSSPMLMGSAPPVSKEEQRQCLQLLEAARLRAGLKEFPYFIDHLMAVHFIITRDVPTLGIDKYLRVYVNPEFFSALDATERAGILVHEVMHVISLHGPRASAGGLLDTRIENIAADLEINSGRKLRDMLPRVINGEETGCFPDRVGLDWGLSMEEYYRKLMEKEEEEENPPPPPPPPGSETFCPACMSTNVSIRIVRPMVGELVCADCGHTEEFPLEEGEGPSEPGDGPPVEGGGEEEEEEEKKGEGDSPDGEESDEDSESESESESDKDSGEEEDDEYKPGKGSGVDGEEQPWELGPPDDENPGIPEAEGRILQRRAAEKVAQSSKSRGDLPGSFVDFCKKILEPPTIPWEQEFRDVYGSEIACVAGMDDSSYRKPSRRGMALSSLFVLASRVSPEPSVWMLLDTSASMAHPDLVVACNEVEGVIRTLSATDPTIIQCDTQVQEVKTYRSIHEMEFKGRGGTDLREGFRVLMEAKEKPDILIVLTDGGTYWPREQPKGVKVIVVLLGSIVWEEKVPAWAKKIVVRK